jgi:single-stranded-DNA-specific exonuclease
MAPFGPGNMKPVFLTRGVVDTGSARIVGDDHLKMSLRMAGGDGRVLTRSGSV